MHFSTLPQVSRSARLAGAAMAIFLSFDAPSLQAQQTMEKPVTDESGSVAVYPPASSEQLAKITHRALRAELLQMARDDQTARAAAT